jgi:hypothetical protein
MRMASLEAQSRHRSGAWLSDDPFTICDRRWSTIKARYPPIRAAGESKERELVSAPSWAICALMMLATSAAEVTCLMSDYS